MAPSDSEHPGTPEGFTPVFGPKAKRQPVGDDRSRKHTKGMTNPQLAKLERTGRVIRMRVAGMQYDEIAAELGISARLVSDDIDRWVQAQKPSEEQTETLRQLMLLRLEELHATYWKHAHGIYEDRWGKQVPNEKAAELILKIQDRQAALMGVNLQPNTQAITVTAESVALFLGWDQSQVVDVEATEVRPALPPASEVGEEQARGGSAE